MMKLRFDFSHFEAVTDEEISQIEQRVNEEILRNTEVDTEEMAIEAAREGAMACWRKVLAKCACADDGRRFLDRAVRGNPCPADG